MIVVVVQFVSGKVSCRSEMWINVELNVACMR